MGFKDLLGSVGSAVSKGISEKNQRIQEYKDKLDYYDTDRLIREYKHSSGDKRLAVMMLLKERGVTASDLE